jgi:5'-methylthioadenosine phosphorylase
VLLDAVVALSAERDCPCGQSLDGLPVPLQLP